VPRQIGDELVELADGLCLVAKLEALLELGQVETALGMARAKVLCYSFAIRVGSAKAGVATRDAIQEVMVGHVSLSSM
jgi:hypothetical protein